MQFINTRFVNSFQMLRESLEAAKSSAGTAENSFKGIEGRSADMRRAASNIDTYEARNDNESKDVSDSGKAALKALKGIARDQDTLEDLHKTEEGARATSSNQLIEASGLARGLNLDPQDKMKLLNAIGNAQQQNSHGSYEYTNVDTTIFTAGLDLPEAINRATAVSEDSDGRDVSLQGTFLNYCALTRQ